MLSERAGAVPKWSQGELKLQVDKRGDGPGRKGSPTALVLVDVQSHDSGS